MTVRSLRMMITAICDAVVLGRTVAKMVVLRHPIVIVNNPFETSPAESAECVCSRLHRIDPTKDFFYARTFFRNFSVFFPETFSKFQAVLIRSLFGFQDIP